MHRDEAIYARADAHAITLTADEATLAAYVIRWVLGEPIRNLPMNEQQLRALADRLSAALTTPSP